MPSRTSDKLRQQQVERAKRYEKTHESAVQGYAEYVARQADLLGFAKLGVPVDDDFTESVREAAEDRFRKAAL